MSKTLPPQQLGFEKLLFPGRSVLYVSEVAEKLEVTEQHVLNLIDEGKLRALNIGIGTQRKFWRIPVEAYEAYVAANLH